MSTQDWVLLGVALACAILAGVFQAADAALQSMSRSRADKLAEDGRRASARVRDIAQDPAPYVNTVMFVRTIFEISTIVLVSLVVFRHIQNFGLQLLIAIGVMVVVSFIMWGVAPRTLGRQRAESIATRTSGLISGLNTVLGPIPQLMILLGNALTPGRGFADGPFSSEAELREMVDIAEASDLIEDGERKMIHSVFDLGDTLLREVMVPRTDVVFIAADKTLRQAQSLALRSGFSRIPVVGEAGLDEVLGIIYLKDITRRIYDHPEAAQNESVDQLVRPVSFSPDSKPVDEVLRDMQRDRNHLVLVVDEFGGTAGLATIEDILEEIVGEIVDEYDAEPTHTEEVDEGTYRISARMSVDDMAELFGLSADDDEVETVGGLMAKLLNVVPIPGTQIIWEGIEITAEKAVGRRHQIDTCLVRRAPEPEPADEESTDDA
ncbi:hemolysin family protein [Propionibacteriaceae bacterium Y1923]|uniref:hemolysin family protein n=1 Tax=Aestuariimicrobium sp. Y1814 TaxID=3418742 RepID=UPI003C258472